MATELNTLFGDEAPVDEASDGVGGLVLGCPFQVTKPGQLAGFRRYGWGHKGGAWSNPGGGADHWGVLRDQDDNVILFVPFERTRTVEPAHDNAWRNHWIHPRVPLLQDTYYTLLVEMYNERYWYFPDRFNSNWSHDNLRVFRPSEGSPAGRFLYTDQFDEALSTSTAAYAVDVLVYTDL